MSAYIIKIQPIKSYWMAEVEQSAISTLLYDHN